MQFNVLGPLELRVAGEPVPLGGLKQRSTLGYLLLNANKAVATSQLLRALWGDRTPPTARKMLQNAVSGLRTMLASHGTGDAEVLTHAPGYLLRVGDDRVDLSRFHAIVEEGRTELASGSWNSAARTLRRALELWRGPALADLVETGIDWPELTALQNSRLAALEDYVEAELAAGRHHEVVAELETAVETEPPREKLCGQLMLALYRCGRQADALSVYRRTRTRLISEFGLDPGHQLQQLERAILNQDPSLTRGPAGPVRSAPHVPRPREEITALPARPSAERPPAPPITERKWVSALLVQTEPTRTASGGHDPEDVDQTFRQLTSILREEVSRFGGTLHSAFGAVWLAAFGVRRTYEDDAERAIRAGFAIRRRLESQPGVAARVAVATGEALVTNPPGGAQAEVSGDVLESCMRLLGSVRPGEMRVCDTTRLASRGAVTYADSGPSAGDVIAVRPEHEAATISLPFVAREREQATLDRLLDDVRERRSPQLVTLLGEPGIGKSRLINEFRLAAEASGRARCLVGRTPRFGWNAPLTALADVVKSYCGISPGDSTATAVRKLSHHVQQLSDDAETTEWLLTHLRPLAGLQDDSRGPDEVGEAFEAWRRFLEEMAAREPLVVVLEDLQSADETLLNFAADLDERLGPVPLLVIATARPELLRRRPSWGCGKRDVTTLTVGPLSRDATWRLLESLLARHGLCHRLTSGAPHIDESRLRRELIDRVGGNPLFAAEHVRMLRNELLPGRELAIPSLAISGAAPSPSTSPDCPVRLPQSVYNIIAARLDTLSRTEKSVLQNAAVFDRVGWAEPIAAISGLGRGEVTDHLHYLEQRGFLARTRERSRQGEVKYEFRHSLVRDVAYSQLPRPDRAEKHQRCAAWLDGSATENAELLEHHSQRGELTFRTSSTRD
ncbi:BTAD domain-containing putative transcriptional regulator [Saccharopolyspora hirsuta]|nr:BTAD domain-containing putative transcriptional regulator [Saccharopolyspora hirsuta]